MTIETAHAQIIEQFKLNSDQQTKESITKAVPQFDGIYSVRMPVIVDLAKQYRDQGFALIELLWKSGTYAERMLAAKLLGFNCRKDPQLSLRLIQEYSFQVDSWALCDSLCSEGIRPVVKKHGPQLKEIAIGFLGSQRMWTRRMGIVLLIHFAKMPDHKEEVRGLISPLRSDPEHYIKKAITWIDRYLNKS